jgi:hypothetical protein
MKTKNMLYNNTVELLFDSFQHRYTIEDIPVPSVTTILGVINKPMLMAWAANTAIDYIREQMKPGVALDEVQLMTIFENAKKSPYQKRKDAGDLGTLVHKWVEDYIHGLNPPVPVNEGMRKSVEQFMSWVSVYNVKFLCSEQMIYSKEHRYTGTLDFICNIDGKLYVGDLKTSKGIYNEYFIQTAAYRHARNEEFPEEKFEGQIIIRVGKDGDFERGIMKDESMYRRMFDGFIAAKGLWETLKRLEEFKPER